MDNLPILLSTKVQNQNVIQSYCSRAKALGVRRGISLRLAQAMAPGAFTAEFNPRYDTTALYRFAFWAATHLSPLVSLDQELVRAWGKNNFQTLSPLNFGIVVDLTGSEKLHGDDEQIFNKVADFLRPHQLSARMAIAPTIGAAWGLARFGTTPATAPANTLNTALAPLPIAALRVETQTVKALGELGIYSIGMLRELPKRTLLSRFGVQLLKRLDQASGAIEEYFFALNLPPAHFTERNFDPPLGNRKAIEITLNQLVLSLNSKLTKQGRQASRFLFRLSGRTPDGRRLVTAHELSLHFASSRPRHLSQILATFTDGVTFPGMVETITLSAASTEPIRRTQEILIGEESQASFAREIGELLNSLALRLGASQLSQATLVATHLPEESFAYKTAHSSTIEATNLAPASIPVRDISERGITEHGERPSYLLAKPEEIVVIALLPDRPPSWFRWRGGEHRVVQSSGPERLCGEWWSRPVQEPTAQKQSVQRDYFRVQDDAGRWLWVFRNRLNRWFVHGLWI